MFLEQPHFLSGKSSDFFKKRAKEFASLLHIVIVSSLCRWHEVSEGPQRLKVSTFPLVLQLLPPKPACLSCTLGVGTYVA